MCFVSAILKKAATFWEKSEKASTYLKSWALLRCFALLDIAWSLLAPGVRNSAWSGIRNSD